MVGTDICCCTAAGWTKCFAWVQIICGALGVAGMAAVVANFDRIEYPEDQEENRYLFLVGFWILLVQCLVTLILGIVLLAGTTKEKIGLLWVWIFIEFMETIVLLITRIIEAMQAGFASMAPALIGVPVFCFVMWCVWCRIRDIKSNRQGVTPTDET